MKFYAVIMILMLTGCALTPENRQAIDQALMGAYAAQLRQDAINAENARAKALNRQRQTNCVASAPNQWDRSQTVHCTTY